MDNMELLLLRRAKRAEHEKAKEERRRRLAQAYEDDSYEKEEVKPAARDLRKKKESDNTKREHVLAGAPPAAALPPAAAHAEPAPLPPQEAFFGTRRLPTDVGLPHMKSSPSSSVSMSQSPPKPPPRKARKKFLDDSSSEEEDIVALARQQRIARPVAKEKESSSSPDNEEPVLKVAAAKKPAHRKKTSSFMDESDDDDDDDDKWLHDFRRSEEAKRKAKLSRDHVNGDPDESDDESEIKAPAAKAKPPRNPLALEREQKASLGLPLRRSSQEGERELWSDSEAEAKPPTPLSSNKKKNAKKDLLDAYDEQLAEMAKYKKTKKRADPNNKKRRDYQAEQVLGTKIPDLSDEKLEELKGELKPDFDDPKFGPFDPPQPLKLGRIDEDDEYEYEVPVSISRYLPKYQREGIRFLFEKAFMAKRGAILGDDMGLGKTVQTIALLSALFKKTGTGLDMNELSRRKKQIQARISKVEAEKQQALLEGRVPKTNEGGVPSGYPSWAPVLITAPNSVVTNWVEDFKTWGNFSVAVYQGKEREAALESIENGMAEVLICGHSMLQSDNRFRDLFGANWKIVIVDEFHQFKTETGHLAVNLRFLRDKLGCLVIGLTGTIMANKHKELWSLVDCAVKDYLGSWTEFELAVAKPIQFARVKDADDYAIEKGEKISYEFSKKLADVYLRRTKEEVLANFLPEKDERIVFCEPSPLQKELYRYILELPDFKLISECKGPCECGVNQKFFLEYKHLRSREEQIEYVRRNKDDLVVRGKCCHTTPHLPDSGEIDPRAVLWREMHETEFSNELCGQANHGPHCIFFSALHILYKLGSHAALLQAKELPDKFGKDSKQRKNAEKLLARAKVFFPEHLLSQLPGGYTRNSSLMDDHFNLSGKMRSLDKLLRSISLHQGRVLLFSYSTQMLDLIESYTMSMGYSHLRMDGQTPTARRKELADEFKSNPNVFLFLLSTRAMGLGLNLTEANYVIIFDVEWNPSNDSQAQDRAYRIGQDKNVTVFRLVSRGTIEELKYLRQVYKTQLKNETIVDINASERKKSERTFRGVADDESRKGELFGMANLLKFKDGTFLNYATKKSESKKYGVGVHDTENLLEQVRDMDEDEVDQIGEEEDMYENLAYRTESGKKSEMDDESIVDDDSDLGGDSLGGDSQAFMNICERVEVREEASEMIGGPEPMKLDGEPKVQSEAVPENIFSTATDTQSPFTLAALSRGVVKSERISNGRTSDTHRSGPAPEPTEKPAKTSDDNQGVCGSMAKPMAEDYSAMETQTESPTNTESLSKKAKAKNLQNGYKSARLETVLESPPEAKKKGSTSSATAALEVTTTKEDTATVSDHQETATTSNRKKKASPRNTQLVGKTTDTIRRGEAGGTTFSASDLPLPGGNRKKKRMKRSNS